MRASMLTLLHQYIPIPSSAKELVPCRMRAMLWGALDAHHTDCGMVAHVRCHENLAWHVALHIQLSFVTSVHDCPLTQTGRALPMGSDQKQSDGPDTSTQACKPPSISMQICISARIAITNTP